MEQVLDTNAVAITSEILNTIAMPPPHQTQSSSFEKKRSIEQSPSTMTFTVKKEQLEYEFRFNNHHQQQVTCVKVKKNSQKDLTKIKSEQQKKRDQKSSSYCCLSQNNQCHCYFFTLFRLNFTHANEKQRIKQKPPKHKCVLCGRGCCSGTNSGLDEASSSKKPNKLNCVYSFVLKVCCCFLCFFIPCCKFDAKKFRANRMTLDDDIEKTSIYYKDEDGVGEIETNKKGGSNKDENQFGNVKVSTSTVDNCFYVKTTQERNVSMRKTKENQCDETRASRSSLFKSCLHIFNLFRGNGGNGSDGSSSKMKSTCKSSLCSSKKSSKCFCFL